MSGRYIYSTNSSSHWRGRNGHGDFDGHHGDTHGKRDRDRTRRRRDVNGDQDRDQDRARRDHSVFHRDPLGMMAEGLGKFVKKSLGVGDGSRSKRASVSPAYSGPGLGSRSNLSNRKHDEKHKDRKKTSRRSSRQYTSHEYASDYRRSTDRTSEPWPRYGGYHRHHAQQYYWAENPNRYHVDSTGHTWRSSASHSAWMPEPFRGYEYGPWQRPSRGEAEHKTERGRRQRGGTQTPPLETEERRVGPASKYQVYRVRKESAASKLSESQASQTDEGQTQSASQYRTYRVKNEATPSNQTETQTQPHTPTTPKKVRFEGIYVHSDLSA